MTHYMVKNLMTSRPIIISPDTTLVEAALQMERANCGVLPVGTPDKLVGIITDRDIVLRAVARGRDPAKIKVSDVMTGRVFSVTEDADLTQVADVIQTQKINRLVVKDSKGNFVGIFSLSRLVCESADAQAIEQFVGQLAAAHRKAA